MKRNFAWKFSTTDKCPLCNTCIEDCLHVMICNDPVAKAKRDELLLQLREALTKIHMDPFIINQVCQIFRLFHSNMQIPPIPITEANTFFEHLKIRFMNQAIDCGVDNIISGVITDYVSSIQDQYN